MRRQRLNLDALESTGKFYLHRQLLATSTNRVQDPIQLVFSDRTTTIGFVNPNFESALQGEGRVISGEGGEQAGFVSDSVVVYASMSGPEIIQESSRSWRAKLFTLLAIQSSLVMFDMFEAFQLNNLYMCVLLTNFFILLSVRRPIMLTISSSLEMGLILTLLYSNPCREETLSVSIGFLTMAFSITMIYCLNGLRDVYLPQTFLMKSTLSDS